VSRFRRTLRGLLAGMYLGTAAILGFSCFQEPDLYNVVVRQEDVLRIAEALAEWSTFTDVQFILRPDGACTGSRCIRFVFIPREEVARIADKDIAIGFAVPEVFVGGYTLYISNDLTPEQEQVTTIHELGHALGLVHHKTYAVMNPTIDAGAGHVTCDDVEQYAALRGLPRAWVWDRCKDPRLEAFGLLRLAAGDGGGAD
jgi:hypothetical protein